MRVCFFTLGCKVNQHETGALQQMFFENGYDICNTDDCADIYVVNSCTVTSTGDKKSLQWLRRAKRNNPNAVTVLTGCYPQAFPEIAKDCDADIITGNTNRSHIIPHIKAFSVNHKKIVDIQPHIDTEKFEILPAESFSRHTRAFMKIEDGCNRACAYCIIPTARGKVRSLPPQNVLSEAKALVAKGYKEIVFSGINLSCYGTDIGTSFADIVEQLAQINGLERIRLGSIEPDLLPEETLVRLSKIQKLCPQFHLSLQSGCNSTLKRMNRMYNAEEYYAIILRLRQLFANATFTTDVIVGFPGETEAEFLQSVSFVEKCNFLKVHVFSYSVRPKTVAANMPDQVPEQTKSARSKYMVQATNAVRQKVLDSLCGSTDTVLLEKPTSDGLFTGYTTTYAPCFVRTQNHKQGDIVAVKLEKFENEKYIATVL